jgi:hypothetical protein
MEEVKELREASDLGSDVERRSHECLGCVIRMNQTAVAKKVTEGKTHGSIVG